jgi:UV DNA damage endonuclease
MRIRFGYVAMALGIAQGSPNKTITWSNLSKIPSVDDQLSKLRRLVRENLDTQIRILRYNIAHAIAVFRFTSRLVPLATYPAIAGWDYCGEFRQQLAKIGAIIQQGKLRISAHPDHYTVLNSPETNVVEGAIEDLRYHAALFDAMGLGNEAKLVLHVGGVYHDKVQSLARFQTQCNKLPGNIRERLIIENDDKSYTARDVLTLCEHMMLPMVFDVHHHRCCGDGTAITDILPAIFATWGAAIPKVHFSSPKDGANARAHADYIDIDEFLHFLLSAKECNRNFDVMIEAKKKDQALFALMDQLKNVPGVTIINQAAIEYRGNPN